MTTFEEWWSSQQNPIWKNARIYPKDSVKAAWQASRKATIEQCARAADIRTDCELECADDLISCPDCIASAIRALE
jgi:hypothetical protein